MCKNLLQCNNYLVKTSTQTNIRNKSKMELNKIRKHQKQTKNTKKQQTNTRKKTQKNENNKFVIKKSSNLAKCDKNGEIQAPIIKRKAQQHE